MTQGTLSGLRISYAASSASASSHSRWDSLLIRGVSPSGRANIDCNRAAATIRGRFLGSLAPTTDASLRCPSLQDEILWRMGETAPRQFV